MFYVHLWFLKGILSVWLYLSRRHILFLWCQVHSRKVMLCIHNYVLSFTGHSGQFYMTYSEYPSWRPLVWSEGDNVIFTVCGEGKKYDKNNSDLLARAIHLKPQNLSYLNSWMGKVFFCLCLCACMFVFLCFCVGVFIWQWQALHTPT